MPKRELKRIIKQYIKSLQKEGIIFEQIYLFGSQVTGNADQDSDIDIAVVMAKLPKNIDYTKRKMDLRKLAMHIDTRIEPILLEKKDLNQKAPSIMGNEVLKHGVLVK